MQLEERINEAVQYIQSKSQIIPTTGAVLGSGLGDFADTLENTTTISFDEIPEFLHPTVEGHSGMFIIGWHKTTPVIVQKGRVHYYEGISQNELTMPVRVMKRLGIKTLILTNAAGGINLDYHPGTLMLISDHINYSGSNPLIGINLDSFGPRFPDMSDVYTSGLRTRIKEVALREQIPLREGVYAMYSGPNYETPAEIRFFRTMGADAVGMSTVPEAIVASHCGLQVIGVSCITNMAAGILPQKLNHKEVIEVAERIKPEFLKLLGAAIGITGDEEGDAC